MTAPVSPEPTRDERKTCANGYTDYERCFAPFRYCPVKGCGRAETPPEKVCAAGVTGCDVTDDHEHVDGGGWRLTEAAIARSGPWSKGIIDQTLGEPVLAELRDNPINEATLDAHSRWVHHKIHRVIWRHAFTDHDCQFTGCLAMMLAESVEMRDVLIEAYERGKRDAKGEPWRPGEYDEVSR